MLGSNGHEFYMKQTNIHFYFKIIFPGNYNEILKLDVKIIVLFLQGFVILLFTDVEQ